VAVDDDLLSVGEREREHAGGEVDLALVRVELGERALERVQLGVGDAIEVSGVEGHGGKLTQRRGAGKGGACR
jgi:hypothetical protein